MSNSGHWFGHVNHCKPNCFHMVGGQQPLVFTVARHGQSAASCPGVCAFRATFAFAISFHLAESFGQRCVQFVVSKLARANWSSEPRASAQSPFGGRPGAAEDGELPWSPGASVPCGFFLHNSWGLQAAGPATEECLCPQDQPVWVTGMDWASVCPGMLWAVFGYRSVIDTVIDKFIWGRWKIRKNVNSCFSQVKMQLSTACVAVGFGTKFSARKWRGQYGWGAPGFTSAAAERSAANKISFWNTAAQNLRKTSFSDMEKKLQDPTNSNNDAHASRHRKATGHPLSTPNSYGKAERLSNSWWNHVIALSSSPYRFPWFAQHFPS